MEWLFPPNHCSGPQSRKRRAKWSIHQIVHLSMFFLVTVYVTLFVGYRDEHQESRKKRGSWWRGEPERRSPLVSGFPLWKSSLTKWEKGEVAWWWEDSSLSVPWLGGSNRGEGREELSTAPGPKVEKVERTGMARGRAEGERRERKRTTKGTTRREQLEGNNSKG